MQDELLKELTPPGVSDAIVEGMARLCHEVNRGICEGLGDYSQKPWEIAADWQKQSSIRGVRFALANPNGTPEHQHLAWCEDKIAEGWKYGPVKDENLKEHPCLVPYGELPEGQRIKDHTFRAIVRALTPRVCSVCRGQHWLSLGEDACPVCNPDGKKPRPGAPQN
jgi:hypothetical protein